MFKAVQIVFYWLFGLVVVCASAVSAAGFQGLVPPPPAVTSSQASFEQLGDLDMAHKYYAKAVEMYKKALLKRPRNATLNNKLGIAYHQLFDYGSAKKSYRKAIRLNPRYAQAINNLAAVEYAQKHYRNAVLMYLRALKLTPGSAVIYSNLGTAYFQMKHFDYAVTSYRYALQLDSKIFQHGGRAGTIVHERDEKNAAAFDFYLAKSYADMKDVENTLLYLRKAWEEGYKAQDILKAVQSKTYKFLANEPGFSKLLGDIRAAEARKAQSVNQ